MISRIAIINIGLALLFVFFAYETYSVWTTEPLQLQPDVHESTGRAGTQKFKATLGHGKAKGSTVSKKNYKDITEKNLFKEERRESIPIETEAEEVVESAEVRIDGRKIELYGVMVMDDRATAMISDPDIKNRKRPTRWVKIGDAVGQFKVESISEEHIVLSDGKDKFKVALWDPDRKRRQKTASNQKAPTVVSTQTSTKERRARKPAKSSKPKAGTDPNEETITMETPFGTLIRKK